MHEEQVKGEDSGEGSLQGYRSASYIPEQVIKGRNVSWSTYAGKSELEVQGRRRKRNRDESTNDSYHVRESRTESFLTKVVHIDQEKDLVRSSGDTQNHTTDMGITTLQWMR